MRLHEKLTASVEVRNKDNKLYENEGGKIVNIAEFNIHFVNKQDIERICRGKAKQFETICKEGTIVNIEVRVYNDLTDTFPKLFSYYGKEDRFVEMT